METIRGMLLLTATTHAINQTTIPGLHKRTFPCPPSEGFVTISNVFLSLSTKRSSATRRIIVANDRATPWASAVDVDDRVRVGGPSYMPDEFVTSCRALVVCGTFLPSSSRGQRCLSRRLCRRIDRCRDAGFEREEVPPLEPEGTLGLTG